MSIETFHLNSQSGAGRINDLIWTIESDINITGWKSDRFLVVVTELYTNAEVARLAYPTMDAAYTAVEQFAH